jgi:hypothetical protein
LINLLLLEGDFLPLLLRGCLSLLSLQTRPRSRALLTFDGVAPHWRVRVPPVDRVLPRCWQSVTSCDVELHYNVLWIKTPCKAHRCHPLPQARWKRSRLDQVAQAARFAVLLNFVIAVQPNTCIFGADADFKKQGRKVHQSKGTMTCKHGQLCFCQISRLPQPTGRSHMACAPLWLPTASDRRTRTSGRG